MKVVIAVLLNDHQQVLITLRALHKEKGGLWEFPGGKVQAEESLEQALFREMVEEIGIQIKNPSYLGCIDNFLYVYLVRDWQGEAVLCEDQQDLAWVPWSSIRTYAFPPANQAIIEMVEDLQHVARSTS